MQPVRGMHDLLPEAYRRHQAIIDVAEKVAARYGFETMSTPLVEDVSVFSRAIGDTSDIVSKEMYEIADKGSDRLVLRPEGTAGVARAVLSNSLTQSLPLKYIYSGPMFRYERPQKGRQRQFHQIGVELFGFKDALGDLEVLSMAWDFLKALGLGPRVRLEINSLGDKESRDSYRTALVDYFSQFKDKLSKDSVERLSKNPLRILDSKDEGDRALVANAPLLSNHLNEASKTFFDDIKRGLDELKIPYIENPRLVRGLDYYCHCAFEFTTEELGSQSTVLAGGRYDGLLPMMGGPEIPGVGWACGIERLAMMADLTPSQHPKTALVCVGVDVPLALMQAIRSQDLCVEPICGNNLGKLLTKAVKAGAAWALIIGEDESKTQMATAKNLTTGEQTKISFGDVPAHLKDVLNT